MRLLVPLDILPIRLDKFLAEQLPQYSRVRLQEGIESGEIKVNQTIVTQKLKLKGGEAIEVELLHESVLPDQPEAIPLRIIYEDESILVLNKPAGLTVHPGAGQKAGTLLNALLHYLPSLANLPRAGIVHRLDKDTSGLMVVAKTEVARLHLIKALKTHDVERKYIAVLHGELLSGCTIKAPIGRHPVNRKKMAVLEHSARAKEAVTHVRVLQKFKNFTAIEASLETGRTHQIRVHLAHLGYPLVGDKLYGKKQGLIQFPRQALQAIKLEFEHPVTHKPVLFEIESECDLAELLKVL